MDRNFIMTDGLEKWGGMSINEMLSTIPLESRKLDWNVLVIDDDSVSLILHEKFLEKFECTVTKVMSAKKALEKCEHTKFDLILTDISMPVMDGVELLKHIREMDNEVVVVVTTANDFIYEGFDYYLPKPVFMSSFIKMMDAVGKIMGKR